MESKVVRRLVVGSIARLDVGLIWRWFLHEVSCGDVCRFVPLGVEDLANTRKDLEIVTASVLLIRIRNMSCQVSEYDTPVPRIRPEP